MKDGREVDVNGQQRLHTFMGICKKGGFKLSKSKILSNLNNTSYSGLRGFTR